MNGMDEAGMMGIELDLLAQPGDRGVDRARERRRRVAPELAQQLVPMHHVTLPLREIVQQIGLALRQGDVALALDRAACHEVDNDLADRQLRDPRARAAQNRAYAR